MFGKKLIRINKNNGSSAIILSLMVSAGVLTTIYFTQKMAGTFFADLSQSMEEWEKHLVAEAAQTLAAYLVSNNLVLCREAGWRGKSSNCKWSTASGVDNPSQFHLSNEVDSEDGLSYTGRYTVDNSEKLFKVTLQLTDYRSTSIENLIGDVPEAICRDKDTLAIIDDATCVPYASSTDPIDQPCQTTKGMDNPDTICEYLKPVDGDHWIVLIKVEVNYRDPVSDMNLKHVTLSGIRRPLSSIKFGTVISGRKCALGCSGGSVASPFPSCRSTFVPTEGKHTGKASNIVSIKNEGPGAIYSLALSRTAVQLIGTQNSYTEDVIPNIIQKAKPTAQVFLPGEIIKFEYFYDCPIEVRRTTVYIVGDKESVEVTSNTRDVQFEKFLYQLNFNTVNSQGICYADGSPAALDPTSGDVNFVLAHNRKLASASCTVGTTTCHAGGQSGRCEFVGLEPARTFIIPTAFASIHRGLVREITTTIHTLPPPIGNVGDGGDGTDGTDGGACCDGP